MSATFDVAVVGSGIVGLGAAYAAARRGLTVVVVDRADAIMGASVRNFGHLCFTPQVGDARRYGAISRELWLRLSRDARFWLRESGTLVVARHPDEIALLEAAHGGGGGPGLPPLGDGAEVLLLDAGLLAARAPIRAGVGIGGALLPFDLQTDPRAAAPAIAAHLERLGVQFRMRTSVGGVSPGRVATTRGTIDAGTVVVATNHDIDQLLPEIAERVGIQRCGLDMLRVGGDFARPLSAPLLTGWSLVRYRAFADLPAAAAVRERLHRERPELAAIDLNQMYTQLPDGSLIVGDTHTRGTAISPFQPERASDILLAEAAALHDSGPLRVIERWQGVYASGPDEFLVEHPAPGVVAIAATTGIGMTTGLGLAEHTLANLVDGTP